MNRRYLQLCKNIEKIDFLDRVMGNFSSKEDILVEIAVLFKEMDNGKLTLEELEELVKLTNQLHERSIILRYKAFEEKIFGEKVVVEETSILEEEIQDEVEEPLEIIEESIPVPQAKVEETKEEPIFGFSLFGELEEEQEIELEDEEEEIIEYPSSQDQQEEISNYSINEVEIENDSEGKDEMYISEIEGISSIQTEGESTIREEEIPSVRSMSEIEKAHAENLARFFNKSQPQNEPKIVESPKEDEQSTPQFIQKEEIQTEYSNKELEEELPEIESAFYSNEIGSSELEYLDEEEELKEIKIEKPIQEIEESIEESTLEIETESSIDQNAKTAFIHKFNQVGSNLASQFGVSKIESLIGSFGLNERLQFINELFDGSSENFSNAIKGLDTQTTSEQARSKVAEFAIANNWDVDSETVEEFMQKIVRRYA